jgi:hypothetical protein
MVKSALQALGEPSACADAEKCDEQDPAVGPGPLTEPGREATGCTEHSGSLPPSRRQPPACCQPVQTRAAVTLGPARRLRAIETGYGCALTPRTSPGS